MAKPLLTARALDAMRKTLYGKDCVARLYSLPAGEARQELVCLTRGFCLTNDRTQNDSDRNQMTTLLIAKDALDAPTDLTLTALVEVETSGQIFEYRVDEITSFQQVDTGWHIRLTQTTPTI